MKIKETAKGNVQITMSKEKAASLYDMLQTMTLNDYKEYTEEWENICFIWSFLNSYRHIL